MIFIMKKIISLEVFLYWLLANIFITKALKTVIFLELNSSMWYYIRVVINNYEMLKVIPMLSH